MILDEKFIPVYFAAFEKQILKKQLELIKPYGLKKSHIMFIMLLKDSDNGLTLTEISTYLGVDRSHTTRVVRELYDLGYLYREQNDSLITKYRIKLNEKGQTIGSEITTNALLINKEVLSVLTLTEKKEFIRLKELLKKIIVENLNEICNQK